MLTSATYLPRDSDNVAQQLPGAPSPSPPPAQAGRVWQRGPGATPPAPAAGATRDGDMNYIVFLWV